MATSGMNTSRHTVLTRVPRRWLSDDTTTTKQQQIDVESQAIPKKVSQHDLQIGINAKLARATSGADVVAAVKHAEESASATTIDVRVRC